MAKKRKRGIGLSIAWIIITVYLFFVLLPFVFTFLTSLKPTNEVTQSPVVYFSQNASLDSYRTVLFEQDYGKYLLNTLIVSMVVVILCALFGIPAAYAMARYGFPLKRSLMAITISIRLIPPIALMVPFFLFMRFFRAIDTLYSLILVNFMLNLPFFIWISWGYFKNFDWAIEEAALLDGAGRLQTLVRIIIPVAAPGLAASAIVAFYVHLERVSLRAHLLTERGVQDNLGRYIGFCRRCICSLEPDISGRHHHDNPSAYLRLRFPAIHSSRIGYRRSKGLGWWYERFPG